MSTYSQKGKGWRYHFILEGTRHTKAWFKTKREAKEAEMQRREEIKNPKPEREIPIDMAFLELVNKRLDYVEAYNSATHYRDYRCMAKKWIKEWGNMSCSQVSQERIQQFILERNKVSAYTANKNLRALRATFNFGKKRKCIVNNPTDGIDFLPEDKKIKYIPSQEDIEKVISIADSNTQDYLCTIKETMARMSEINRLTWNDVDLKGRYVILYTRKKKGGHLTPRKVPMTQKLHEILLHRYSNRDKTKPWVFWHNYWSSKTREKKDGPFRDRKKIMKTLCRKADVKYFRYHALRHFGASLMDNSNVPIGSIQRILGHENRTTTEIYLHSISEAERAAMDIYEQAQQKLHTNLHTDKNKGLSPST